MLKIISSYQIFFPHKKLSEAKELLKRKQDTACRVVKIDVNLIHLPTIKIFE
jgi:hypothetical protein